MSDGPTAELLARYLRQQKELGQPEIVLDRLEPEEVLRALEAAVRSMAGTAAASRDRPFSATASGGEKDGPGDGERDGPGDGERDGPGDAEIAELGYEQLREVALGCTRCRLAEERKQVVFSDGNPDGRLMVVGEAPGANEDRTGLPFVGQAGKLLDLLLAAVDLSRKDSVYICNVLKCRPPGNRNPMADEIELCAPYLKRQIALVQPGAILAVGTFAAQLLTGDSRSLGKLRGDVYSYEGVPLIVTYHPAALLRNPNWTRATWDDLQLLRQVID